MARPLGHSFNLPEVQLQLIQQVIIVKNPPLTGLDEVNKWAGFLGGFILGEKLCWHRDSSPRLYDPSTEFLKLDKNQIRRNLHITGINLVPPVSFVAHVAHVANMLPMLPMLQTCCQCCQCCKHAADVANVAHVKIVKALHQLHQRRGLMI